MTSYTEFDADIHQIQLVASLHESEAEQIARIQHIAMAAAYCLADRMGPRAAAYWLRQISGRIEAQARGDVH